MNKSILFLGGSGFVGKSFASSFAENKFKNYKIGNIILISKKNTAIRKISNNSEKKNNIKIISKDLLKIKDLPYADYILYAAEYVDPKKIYKKFTTKEDIKTLNNIFKILERKKFKKSKILYLSSGAVYDNTNSKIKRKIKETSKVFKYNKNPKSASEIYIRNKLLGEYLIKKLAKNFKRKTSIARCFTFFGKYYPLKSQYVLGNFINSVINKKPLKIYEKSSKTVYRSFLHSDELIKILLKIVSNSNRLTPIYNVGSDKEISIWDLAKFVSKTYKIKFIYPTQNKKKFDFYVPNINKLKRKFSFRENLVFKESLNTTIDNIKFIN